MEGKTNLTARFVTWWYGGAVTNLVKYIKAAYVYSADLFSVGICLRTIFDPWKRDMLSYAGQTLQQRFNTWTLNLASRFVGVAIKLTTLAGYLLFTICLTGLSAAVIVVWLVYPGIIVYLLYKAVVL